MVNAGDAFPAGEDYLVRRIKDLERQVSENASSIPRSFQTTVDSLTATIARLDAQVAAIAAVVNAQVTGTVGHSSASGYALTNSAQELTRTTITVPTGFTRALVFATSSMTIGNNSSSSGDVIRGYIDINGNAAPVSGGQFASPSIPISMSVSFSSLITGLTGGSTFYARAVFYNEINATGAASVRNICNLDAVVTFLR